jgi:hypothetical protein
MLSIVIIPLVLKTYARAYLKKFDATQEDRPNYISHLVVCGGDGGYSLSDDFTLLHLLINLFLSAMKQQLQKK